MFYSNATILSTTPPYLRLGLGSFLLRHWGSQEVKLPHGGPLPGAEPTLGDPGLCPFAPSPWFAGRPPGDAQPEMAPLAGSLSGSSHFVPKQEAIRNTYQKSNLLY